MTATDSDSSKDKDYCLDENMKLKTTHPYYIQVQLQMFVGDLKYTDFVLWMNKSFKIQRILWDQEFISALLIKLELVWRADILQEVFTRSLKEGISAEGLSPYSKSHTSQSQTRDCTVFAEPQRLQERWWGVINKMTGFI